MIPYVLLARSMIHFILYHLYEQTNEKTATGYYIRNIRSESAKCKRTEDRRFPLIITNTNSKKILYLICYNLAGIYHELSKNKIPISS